MALNRYFSQKVKSEQNLYEDIVIESLKIYGQDVYYLPRQIVNEDRILGEDVPSRFSSAYQIEMYIENVEGFDGEGDLFTKFGVEIRDQATFIVSKKRWNRVVGDFANEIQTDRPLEGDLIYLPLSNSMFQIMQVEHEQPFYQLSNLPTFKLRCELFEYNDEDFDTDIPGIDGIEEIGYTIDLQLLQNYDSERAENPPNFLDGDTVTQVKSNGKVVRGEVVKYNRTTQILTLAHIGGDSGEYVMFEPGNIRVPIAPFSEVFGVFDDNIITRRILSVSENIAGQNEQNVDFNAEAENIILDFLDFSETNPFGDPQD